jgi:UDP-N-acetylmuramate dehydrogenase
MNPHSLAPELADVADCLKSLKEGEVATDKSLAPYTFYRIGGPTAVWAAPFSSRGVQRVLQAVHAAGVPLFILGRGSNLLVSDHGWPGVTLHIGDNLNAVTFAGQHAEAEAGSRLVDLIQAALERGLGGMEPLTGIPGSVGGALRMNAGAFGREIEALTEEVAGYTFDGTPIRVTRSNISFGYRRAPELEGMIITSGRFGFQPDSPQMLKARAEEILALRARKQPLDYPSCGSVFKRPPGYYAGALIEEAGLKGERCGGAEISRKHAGFILNVGSATASDVYRLMRRIEDRVWERFGVRLEREVQLVGDFGD